MQPGHGSPPGGEILGTVGADAPDTHVRLNGFGDEVMLASSNYILYVFVRKKNPLKMFK